MKINRLLTNICTEKLVESKDFYTSLFDFQVDFESDWFIHLISEDKQLELGLSLQNHDIVPDKSQNNPQGVYLTFVVENVDIIYQLAQDQKLLILEKPHDTFYGQRRLLLEDPNGLVVDVSSPLPMN